MDTPVEKEQKIFKLTIMADSVDSTDQRFDMDDLGLGDNYRPLGAIFQRADGKEVTRAYRKGERRNSNQTLPRLACQVFEKQIAGLTVEDKENFPICQYNPNDKMRRGIYSSVEEYRKHYNSMGCVVYKYDNGRLFVITS